MDIEQQWNAANVLVVFRPFHIGDREPAAVERQTG
jgi:hypothetical protein